MSVSDVLTKAKHFNPVWNFPSTLMFDSKVLQGVLRDPSPSSSYDDMYDEICEREVWDRSVQTDMSPQYSDVDAKGNTEK